MPAASLCSHISGPWTQVDDVWSPFNQMWVHSDPDCLAPSPGHYQAMVKSLGVEPLEDLLLPRNLCDDGGTPESTTEETAVIETITPTTFAEAEVVLAQRLPGYESRPQQQALATAIESAFANREHLLGEAGCGTGKSLGGMIPAILSGKRTVVATATIALMEQYANKDLPFLEENLGVDFTWALLKGRSNYLCLAKTANPENIDPALVQALVAETEADPNHTGDREHFVTSVTKEEFSKVSTSSQECPGKRECPFGDICFAEKAKRKAADADLVITNTAMLMTDLKVREATEGFGSMLGPFENLIIDEAHELEEIATSQLEETFRPSSTTRLLKDCGAFATTHETFLKSEVAVQNFAAAVQATLPDPKGEKVRLGVSFFFGHFEAYLGLVEALKALRDEVMEITVINGDRKKQQAKRNILTTRLANQIRRYETLITADEADLVRWVEDETTPRGETVRVLHFAPINVAPFLTEWLWNDVTAVLISATMSVAGDFTFIKSRLGLADAKTVDVGTPFDYDTQALLFVPDSRMPSPKMRGAWMNYAQTATMELIERAGGGALLLFTSRSAMQAAYDDLAARIEAKGFTVLMQGRSGTNKEIARTFQEDTHSVLFALKSFFTGVDIQGDACRLVVIDKLPFPVPSEPVFQARGDALKRQGKSDFSDLSMPIMTLTLVQGYGRLIRTKKDKGVVAILDSRLTSTGWGQKIVRSLPDSPATTSLAEVGAFFQGA